MKLIKQNSNVVLYTICFVGVISFVLLSIFLPNHYQDKGENFFKINEMIFYGSIISGGISGIITFLVLLITYSQNNKQFATHLDNYEEEKRLAIMPYLDIHLQKCDINKLDSCITVYNDIKSTLVTFQDKFSIKNVGHGNCFNLKFKTCVIGEICINNIDYFGICDGFAKGETNIEKGEERFIGLGFKMGKDWYEEKSVIVLSVEYNDIIGTYYEQNFNLLQQEKKLYITQVSFPKKVQKTTI